MAIRRTTEVKPERPIQVNLTPMVDIVFLLIIFFALVSQFISAENITVDLPNPDESLAKKMELPDRVVLNCQYAGQSPAGSINVRYQLGPIAVEDIVELEGRLRAVREEREDVQVILRADRRITYDLLSEVMQAITRAGVQHINIAAQVGE